MFRKIARQKPSRVAIDLIWRPNWEVSLTVRNKLHCTIRHLPLATQVPTSKPRRAFVDAAFALDEIGKRLIQVFEFCRVRQHPRPFTPRPIIDLFRIGRAMNDGCEGLRLPDRRISSQAQCPICTVDWGHLLTRDDPGASLPTWRSCRSYCGGMIEAL
jgi:hypothetical protein